MEITIYGASDDLVEVKGCKGADEFTVPSPGGGRPDIWCGDLIAPDGGSMRVHVLYDGCWHVGVGQVDEDIPVPNWPMTFRTGTGPTEEPRTPRYSTVLTVTAPAGTRLTNVSGTATD